MNCHSIPWSNIWCDEMEKYETFRQELIADVRTEAIENQQYEQIQFIETISGDLSSYDKCPVAIPCYYSRTGRRNRKMLVHGYNYDDFDNTLSLFISDYTGSEQISTITYTDFSNYVKQAVAFIEDSLEGYVQSISDCSDEGYGLAKDIETNRENIERYAIYVISDRRRSDRFKNMEEANIDRKKLMCRLLDIEFIYDSILENSESENIRINVESISGVSGIPCMDASKDVGYSSYLCVVPGVFLACAYKEYGSKLLESNVRSYLGYTSTTNKGIRQTINNEPHLFFAYNNGVTTTCTDIERNSAGEITEFEDLQIVNGGQTTVSIFNEWKKNPDSVKNVFVPMKLTVASPELAKEIVPNISKYANFQNAVKKSDLDSNDEFQKLMENFSRNTRIPQGEQTTGSTKWYYERTRKQFDQDPVRINNPKEFKRQYDKSRKIDKLAFGRYRCMILMMPDKVAKGKEDCYNKTFKPLVAEKWADNKDYFNSYYFKETVAMVILYKAVYKELPNREWFGQRSSIRDPLTFYSICKLLDMLDKNDMKLDFMKIWNTQSVDDVILRQVASIAKEMVLYIDKIQAQGTLATQWFKREECWRDVQNLKAPLDPNIINFAISKSNYNIDYKKARIVEESVRVNTESNSILTKSPMFWKQLALWYEMNVGTFSMVEQTLVKKLQTRGNLTDLQVKRAKELVENAKSHGFKHNELD